ncbi:acyl-CoA dehydrogenase family protein [Pyruvatibacter sp.]|uniref:acyl-CoA dehydrogenase family protein n=1 Tax=Pyruvatibacter sp. TaxID=1981328 RepID=UPI0032ECD1B8
MDLPATQYTPASFSPEQVAMRDHFRKYMMAEIDPHTAALEAGENPYPLMKKMVGDLGLAGDADKLEKTGGVKSDTDAADRPNDPDTAALMRFARTQVQIELARVNPGFAMSWGASVGLFGSNVRSKGTPDQIKKYVPDVMRGEKTGSWCLTEPGAGSDAFGSMKTSARPDGDDYVLNGSKTFITNAPYADVFLVYARNTEDGSIQAFIVERGFKGVDTSKPFDKMGMKSSPTGQVFLDDVRVPAENLLGGGMKDRDHVRKSLASERIGIAVLSYAIAERCYDIAVDYAKTREQGGQAIGHYQLIQNRLARMYVDLSNARRIVYSSEEMDILDACAGKLFVAEAGTRVAMESIHILAGNGYMSEYVVERLARDAKLLELGGGTTEIQIITIGKAIMAG